MFCIAGFVCIPAILVAELWLLVRVSPPFELTGASTAQFDPTPQGLVLLATVAVLVIGGASSAYVLVRRQRRRISEEEIGLREIDRQMRDLPPESWDFYRAGVETS